MTDQKQFPVITIGREYGAGGRSVAKLLAEKLDLPWYDKDFIRDTVKESGISEEDILKDGEELSGKDRFLDSILNSMVSYTSAHDAIFNAQREEVIRLSAKPCIIVGRCANIILQEAGIPSFDVFLYADMAHRMERAAQLSENGETDLQKYIETRDKLRANYYRNYTKKEIGDYRDYDLMLNTGLLGMEGCAELIAEICKQQFN